MSVSNILSLTSSNIASAVVQQLSKNFKEVTLQVQEGDKFKSRAEVEEAGFDKEFDKLSSIMSRLSIYDTTTSLARSTLNSKQIALTDINTIITKFRGAVDKSSVSKSNVEKVDDALNAITKVLNRKENGAYIFGGKKANQLPVQVDLTTLTTENINSFTNVTPVHNIVQISEKLNCDTALGNVLDVQPLIKALILSKNIDSHDNRIHVELALTEALKSFALVRADINYGIKDIDAAIAENITTEVAVKSALEENFNGDLIGLANKMNSIMQSFFTSLAITAAGYKVLGTLTENFNI